MERIQSNDLFQCIQQFLQPIEYLQLMSSSKSRFSLIKRDTMIYNLIISEGMGLDSPQLSNLAKVVDVVNNPRKQIDLSICYYNQFSGLHSLRFIISYVHNLSLFIDQKSTSSSLDCSLFDDIPFVRLYGFPGIKNISRGFRHVQELGLQMVDLEEIGFIASCTSLRRFWSDCSKVHQYSSQAVVTNEIEEFLLHNEIACDWIKFESIANNPMDMSKLFSFYLQDLSLVIEDPTAALYLPETLFCIPKLYITYDHIAENGERSYWLCPIYYGKELTLTGFYLWTGLTSFADVKVLELTHCLDLLEMPKMPYLTELHLHHIPTLLSIRSLQSLRWLTVDNLTSLNIVYSQPKLKGITLNQLSSMTDVSSLRGMALNYVEINNCPHITDISLFITSYQLKVIECPNTSSIQDLVVNTTIPLEKRRITLQSSPGTIQGFTTISNIQEFRLIDMVGLDPFTFDHIQDLELTKCTDLIDLPLMTVKHSLIINSCTSLCTLHGISGIPKVALCSLPCIKRLRGLRKHELVMCYEVPLLADKVIDYCEQHLNLVEDDDSEEDAFDNNDDVNEDDNDDFDLYEDESFESYEMIFQSISSFTIVVGGTLDSFSWDDVRKYQRSILW